VQAFPENFTIAQKHPNIFNPVTTISYYLPRDSDVTLTIYDITGRLIETIVDQKQNGGHYTVQWDASDLPSGVHFHRIQAGDFHIGQYQNRYEAGRVYF